MSVRDGCQVELGTGMELVVLGSGGPRSEGRAASSYLIAIDGAPRLLVDVGPGTFVRLGETGLSDDRLQTVLLTHLHIDHAGDLPALVKSRDLAADGPVHLRIFGPEGGGPYPATTTFVERLFGPAGAFAYLAGFRNELRLQTADVKRELGGSPQLVFEERDLRVTAVAVDHGNVPALAYRVEHAGLSLVFSGDLASKRGSIEELARGADLLVYDGAVLDPPGSRAPLYELHTAPRRIGEVARAAGVRALVLSHIPRAVAEREQQVIASVRATFAGGVRLAQDCMQVPFDSE